MVAKRDIMEEVFEGFDLISGPPRLGRDSRPQVERLRGTWREFWDIHNNECLTAQVAGGELLEILIAQLHARASDERHLFATWTDLASSEKTQPGTTVFAAVATLNVAQIRYAIKLIRRTMRNPKRSPRPDDLESWNAILPVADALIQEALYRILEPLFAPRLDQVSTEILSVDNRKSALDAALALSAKTKRYVWLTADVSDPFDRVPRGQLLDEFWEELPNRKLIFLIEDMCSAPAENGIRADSRLASLLMDFYLYRTVVYNWRKRHRHVPLLRCGGSFLVLCKTRKRAESLHVDLKKLLSKSGMPMDESQGTLISRLAAGEKVSWLGYEISRQDSAWVVDAADSK